MFENTPKCCIKGCDSDKYKGTKNIGSFQFPIHDEILLQKWLRQIDLPHWKPSAYHRICSMHFQPDDILSRPNEKQLYLKLTSIPTIFPSQPVEVVNLNGTSPLVKPEDPPTKHLMKLINLVGDTPTIQARPVILIGTQYPRETAQFPAQMVVQNIGQTSVNNSMEISTQYVKQIGVGDSQMPLHNSAELIKQINVQNYTTYRYLNRSGVHNLSQIDAERAAQIVVQSPRAIFTPSPAGFLEQVTLQSVAEFSERYSKQDPRSRLRKILPKPQSFHPDTLPTARRPQKPRTDSTPNAVPKPDVLIVPRIEEPNPNGSGKRFFYRYPGNKRPILRISIDKEYSLKNTDCPSDKEERRCLRSSTKTQTTEKTDSSSREMTIENSSTNKAVTFTLDPKTGEIVVTTRQLDVSTGAKAGLEPTRTERKVDVTHTPMTKLRQRYLKGQQECISLERRLRLLRRRHEREQKEIEMLEDHLTVHDDEVPRTRCEDPTESRCPKRKEADENGGHLDEPLPSLPKVRKTKEDSQTERDIRLRDPSTRPNGRSKERKNQTGIKSNKEASRFPDSREIGISSKGETACKTAGNCGNIVGKVNEASADFNRH